MVTMEERGDSAEWESAIDMYALLYLKQITNKDLLDIAQGTLLNIL